MCVGNIEACECFSSAGDTGHKANAFLRNSLQASMTCPMAAVVFIEFDAPASLQDISYNARYAELKGTLSVGKRHEQVL